MYGAFVASLGVVALLLASNETTFARSAAAAPRAGLGPTHSISHRSAALSLRHHRRGGAFWPGEGGYFYAPTDGEPVGVAPPNSGDIHYTYTYDVPWDWAHRYPPDVVPSNRPYVTTCPTEPITVRGRDGSDQVVNVTRCY
jgi:hypothetical protein